MGVVKEKGEESTLYKKVKEEPIGWVNKHLVVYNAGALLVFILFASIQNWSLLVGQNLMKYDIWDAEYPLQVMMSDAISNHTVPIWNPLMQYGSPNYAMVGTPVWYPLTLILACIGYTPTVLAVSYVMHIVIGSFGMFLLAGEELKGKDKGWKGYNYFTSVIVGLIYGTSGVFLSNAQHIMIIISIAWMPYVFYYVRRYLEKGDIVFAMSAGLCAGLVFLGGYPEMFYDLFLFLIPYVAFFNYKKGHKILLNLTNSVTKYLMIAGFTILASAISLIPFLKNMSRITRGTGLGQIPQDYSIVTFLSFLLPKTTRFVEGTEISMVNYYMGLLVILLVPAILVNADRNKKLYLTLVIIAFFLCMGNNSFFHPLLYHFLPMYDSFRFPTLNRCFLTIFMLLMFTPALNDLLENGVDSKTIKYSMLLFFITGAMGLGSGLVANLLTDAIIISKERCLELAESAFFSAAFIASYLIIFLLRKKYGRRKTPYAVSLACIISVELLSFAYAEGPITITRYQYTEYSYNPEVQERIKSEVEKNKNRNRAADFAGQVRSASGLDSQTVVFNKTFDEEGYLSFLLKSISDFKGTYYRNIIEQNPVVYFTNDTVSGKEVDYSSWINACNTSPGQIYVEDALPKKSELVNGLSSETAEQRKLNLINEGGSALIEDYLCSGENKTGRVRAYFEKPAGKLIYLDICFADNEGGEQTYAGEFTLHDSKSGAYADIYFPNINQEYQSLRITTNELPILAELVSVERMAQDKYAYVNRFGFNDIDICVDAPVEGYVMVLQAYHDGWSAYVDGKKAEISLVDQCFMGIRVDPGEHTVEMRFRPKDFFAGVIITNIYLVITVLVWMVYFRTKRKDVEYTIANIPERESKFRT